jgi:hypothetical protein
MIDPENVELQWLLADVQDSDLRLQFGQLGPILAPIGRNLKMELKKKYIDLPHSLQNSFWAKQIDQFYPRVTIQVLFPGLEGGLTEPTKMDPVLALRGKEAGIV